MSEDRASPMDGSARRLVLSLVGELRIEVEGEGPLRLAGRMAAALVAFLAMRPGLSATRSRLCDLLWRDAEQARSRLRQTLLALRRSLADHGVDALVTEQDVVSLRPDRVACDLHRLERALAEDSLEGLAAVAGSCKGPLLDGFFASSPAFEDWA